MAKLNFEDEETQTTPTKGKGKLNLRDDEDEITTPSPVTQKSSAISVSDDDNCEFGDTKLMRKSDGLDRIRPGDNNAIRFAVMPGVPLKKAFNHYIKDKGTFRCATTETSEGACCKQLGAPNLQIVALVVHYTNANPKTGKYSTDVTDTECEIKYVALSRTNFADISGLVQEDEKPDDFDIVMTKREGGKGYKVARVSKEARWKKNKAVREAMFEAAEKFKDGVLMTKKLGRQMDSSEWKALLSSVTGSDEESDDNSDL